MQSKSEKMKQLWKNPEYRAIQITAHSGYKHTEDQKRKISKSLKGHHVSNETRKKIGNTKIGNKYMLGKTHSNETKQKISIKNNGKKRTEEIKRKISDRMKGLYAGEKNFFYKKSFYGEKSPNWIHDRNMLKKKDYRDYYGTDSASKDWAKQVKSRDGWKCKISNKECYGRLEAHHILSWKYYPEVRYDVNNGISLCHYHHPKKRKDEIESIDFLKKLLIINI